MLLLEIPIFLLATGFALLFVFFLIASISAFLKKAAPGMAIVKTGLGINSAQVSTSSSIVIPMIHKAETIDLTVKIVRISRKQGDSLSCADGIRAEVEVDFYIKINPIDEDIRRVANSVGCVRASNIQTIRELFEAKFSDALKTAGSKLVFDQLYQNRREFRDQILIALGQEGDTDVILNGYRLDDVAIQYLEQLPLTQHDEKNVLDAKGIKEIAQRTAKEAELANKRLREKEVVIAEQNQLAETRQLEIEQDLSFKRAMQKREIDEKQAIEQALAEKTKQEQKSLEEQAMLSKERTVEVANQKKQEEIAITEKNKERSISVTEEEKLQAIETAKIKRESQIAEQLKEKLQMLQQTALQEAEKIKAEQQVITVQAVEQANRAKQIEVINAQKSASVELAQKNVAVDVEAYKMITEAKAKLDSATIALEAANKQVQTEIMRAEKDAKIQIMVSQAKFDASTLEFQASEKQAEAIKKLGEAHAQALLAKVAAENTIGKGKILSEALPQLIPLLPQIIEKIMLPAEKIDSIKFLNIQGMDKFVGGHNGSGNTELSTVGSPQSPMGSIVNTIMSVSVMMPLLKEIVKTIKSDAEYGDLLSMIRNIPGGENLLSYIDKDQGKE